jgi:hypothetical protein
MLNGIVHQVELTKDTYDALTTLGPDSQISFIFTATRLPARKKNFQVQTQASFHYFVPSKILITPYTVTILHREQDLVEAMG